MATLAPEAPSTSAPSPLPLEPATAGPPRSGSRRDFRLDFLRGLCVVVMLIDHVGGASWWYLITGGDQFFVSAAEGFVFISGLVMGLVYRRVLQQEGALAVWRKALGRTVTLYLLTVVLTAVAVGLSLLTNGPWTGDFLASTNLGEIAWG